MINSYTSRRLQSISNMRSAKSQQGLVMFITLISLVIMLLSSIALIRSTDANLLVSGHLSFKRDIVNQAERTIPNIKALFAGTGALAVASSRESDISTNNYFSTIQPSNNFGIPTALIDTSSAVYTNTSATISDPVTAAGVGSGTTIHYMIDRMCLTTGAPSPSSCALTQSGTDPTGKKTGFNTPGIDTPIYRISIRITGPRNTEAFLQSTFTAQ